MNEVLFYVHNIGVTPWKLVGYLGVFLFASRWFVQIHATRKRGRVHMPITFWWLSMAGSVLLLCYFTFGKNDSVGVLANLLPLVVATYNLGVELRDRRENPIV